MHRNPSYSHGPRPEMKYTNRNRVISKAIAKEIIQRESDSKDRETPFTQCTLEAIEKYVKKNNKSMWKSSGVVRAEKLKRELQKHPENYDAIKKILLEGNEDDSSFKTFFIHHIIATFCTEQQKQELSNNFSEIYSYYKEVMPACNTMLYQGFLEHLMTEVMSLRNSIVMIELSSIPTRSQTL